MDEDKKPAHFDKPYWYCTWLPPIREVHIFFGKVYGRYVFNFDTTLISFGYVW